MTLTCWVIDLVKPSGWAGKRAHIKTVTSPESEGLSVDEPPHAPASLHKKKLSAITAVKGSK